MKIYLLLSLHPGPPVGHSTLGSPCCASVCTPSTLMHNRLALPCVHLFHLLHLVSPCCFPMPHLAPSVYPCTPFSIPYVTVLPLPMCPSASPCMFVPACAPCNLIGWGFPSQPITLQYCTNLISISWLRLPTSANQITCLQQTHLLKILIVSPHPLKNPCSSRNRWNSWLFPIAKWPTFQRYQLYCLHC